MSSSSGSKHRYKKGDSIQFLLISMHGQSQLCVDLENKPLTISRLVQELTFDRISAFEQKLIGEIKIDPPL